MNNRNENRWYMWLSILLVIVVTFPYLLGFAIQTDELLFSGSFIGVDDQNSYLAKMRAGYEGEWLNQSPYTNFPQNDVAVYLPFVYLGKLAGGENLVGQFQFLMLMLRVASVFLYIYALRKFFDIFLPESVLRKAAIILVVFGGGFGFLYFVGLSGLWGGRLPLEVYSPEAFSFLALITLPHIIIARSFLLLSIYTWYSKSGAVFGNLHINYKFLVVIYSYMIYLFQPIALPILFGILSIYFILQAINDFVFKKDKIMEIFRKEYFRSLFIYFVLMIPAIAYNLYLLLFDPYIKAWGAQNKLFTAPPQDYLFAYAVFLFLSVIYFVKEKNIAPEVKALGIWVVISLIGIYLPISIQRRFIEGAWIFLILFSILCVKKFIKIQEHQSKMRIAIFVFCLSSLFILSGSIFQILSKPNRVFVNNSKAELYDYINNNIQKQEIIFTNHDIGNEVPLWTSTRTITGVGPESINEQEYLSMYQDYINGDMSRENFEKKLANMDIRYFIIEKVDGMNCDLLFENDSYLLCRVGENE